MGELIIVEWWLIPIVNAAGIAYAMNLLSPTILIGEKWGNIDSAPPDRFDS